MYVAGTFFHNFSKAEKLDRKYGFGPIIARRAFPYVHALD
jgi:hypothetical protein